jgi:hypothetical protein
MARIDYQKAFDRVSHSWIIKYLELTGINNKIISFAKKIMSHWRTWICVHTENKLIETEDRNTMCNNPRRLIITTTVLHFLNPPHRTTEQAEHGI